MTKGVFILCVCGNHFDLLFITNFKKRCNFKNILRNTLPRSCLTAIWCCLLNWLLILILRVSVMNTSSSTLIHFKILTGLTHLCYRYEWHIKSSVVLRRVVRLQNNWAYNFHISDDKTRKNPTSWEDDRDLGIGFLDLVAEVAWV